jgi:hypothetical protein
LHDLADRLLPLARIEQGKSLRDAYLEERLSTERIIVAGTAKLFTRMDAHLPVPINIRFAEPDPRVGNRLAGLTVKLQKLLRRLARTTRQDSTGNIGMGLKRSKLSRA